MTFKSVVLKNMTSHLRQYLSFFLSSTFCVMFFFMYAAMLCNDQLNGRKDTEVLEYVFPITIVAIGLFSIFFINYTHHTFLRQRNKEFGVYMTLGMDAKQLGRFVAIESGIIMAAAMVVGIVAGSLFSRLFQMIILDMMEITDVTFYLDIRAFFITIAAFLLLFGIHTASAARKLRKSDIQTILSNARKSDGMVYKRKDAVLGIAGLVILGASIPLLVVIAGKESLYTNPVMLLSYVLVAFSGTYLMIAHGGNYILWRLKHGKNYYRNLLGITEFHYKYNQNKKIMFVLTILSTMTIFFVASPYSLLNLCGTIAQENKSDLEFVVSGTIRTNYEEVLANVLPQDKIESQEIIPMLLVQKSDQAYIPVISVSQYNNCMNTDLVVEKGQLCNAIFDWRPGNGGYAPQDTYTVTYQGTKYSYIVAASVRMEFVAKSYPCNAMLILSDEDYEQLSRTAKADDMFSFVTIQLKDWKNTKAEVETLESELMTDGYPVNSVYGTYRDLKKGYSVFLFVFIVLGVLFFVAGGSVLFFRQYSELPKTKETFHKLFKIGMTKKETLKMLKKQLLVIFYVPVIFGAFLGLSVIYLMTNIMNGEYMIREFMTNASKVVVLYAISQSIFYLMSRRKYRSELNI